MEGGEGRREKSCYSKCLLPLTSWLVRTSVVEEGGPLREGLHVGWGEESGHPATDLGTGSRVEDNRCITEQLQASATWTTHTTYRRGNSTNHGGQGNEVAAGLSGPRNRN